MTDLVSRAEPHVGAVKVMVCLGTRPEAIKLAPVIEKLRAEDGLDVLTVSTSQHREMLDQTLPAFGLTPDVDLELMSPRQDLAELASRAIAAVGREIAVHRPQALLVQGDTTTALCAGLAGAYARVPVGHVEAGLRTGDRDEPFPEELNRRLIAQVARWHFCPTSASAVNLRSEGFPSTSIFITQNTVVDALLALSSRPASPEARRLIPERSRPRRLLVTVHRRETHGERQRVLFRTIARLAARPDVEVLFPVHLNPAVRESATRELAGCEGVRLLEPLAYGAFIHAMSTSDIILTDSGGVQEEAPALNVPVVVLREKTERPEGIASGCAYLAGTSPSRIERVVSDLLDDPVLYQRMAEAPNPYGDGRASERIVRRLREDLLPDSPVESEGTPAHQASATPSMV